MPSRSRWIEPGVPCYSGSFHAAPITAHAAPIQAGAIQSPGLDRDKYDGFRALARFRSGGCQLISRNGNPFSSFSGLADAIAASLPNVEDAILDGEIVCLDKHGHPQFKNLMFRRGYPPCFFAFDLLTSDGKDLRTERLLDRKQELRRCWHGRLLMLR